MWLYDENPHIHFSKQVPRLRKFKLLLWIGIRSRWYNRKYLLPSFIMPFILSLILMIIRSNMDVKFIPEKQFEPVEPELYFNNLIIHMANRKMSIRSELPMFTFNVMIPQAIISYAPNNIDANNNIMAKAASKLNAFEIQSFLTCDEMRKNATRTFHFACVCFYPDGKNDNTETGSAYPSQLNYSLSFPGERRTDERYIGMHWDTLELLSTFDMFDRHIRSKKDEYSEYLGEGVLHLQNIISTSYIERLHGLDDQNQIPQILMQRLPYFGHYFDQIDSTNISLPLCVLISFYYPIVFMIKQRVLEEERDTNQLLRIMGLQNWLQVVVCLLLQLIILLLSSILFLTIIKINALHNPSVYSSSSSLSMLFFFLSYNFAGICFCYMLTACMRHSISVTAVCGTIWALTFLPYFILVFSIHKLPYVLHIFYLFPNTVLALALKHIAMLEKYERGLQFSQLLQNDQIESLRFNAYLLVLCISSFVYLLIGLLVDCIATTEWRNLCRFNKTITHRPFKNGAKEVGLPIARLQNVTKNEKGHDIVRNVTIDLHTNEIVTIMGFNSCGKGTLLKMIMGWVTPTSGSISVHNSEQGIVGSIGFCTTLFDYLTVEDQLFYFGIMKGLTNIEAKKEVLRYLTAVEMFQIRNAFAEHITKSQQELLKACCALIGTSKLVLLEKPTKHMDTYSTALFCQLLNHIKIGRCILMTSHNQDVIAAVADRVFVMVNGEIISNFGPFFKNDDVENSQLLICIKGEQCDDNEVTLVINRQLPTIQPKYVFGREITYRLDNCDEETIMQVLNDLEANESRLDLKGLSIRKPFLEEIFYMKAPQPVSNVDLRSSGNEMIADSNYNNAFNEVVKEKPPGPLEGAPFYWQQFITLLNKRFIIDKFYILQVLTLILVPTIVIHVAIQIGMMEKSEQSMPVQFEIDAYGFSNTIAHSDVPAEQPVGKIYKQYLKLFNNLGNEHKIKELKLVDVASYILKKQRELRNETINTYIIAATFKSDSIIAWYNNLYTHSAPLSLNLVHNSILRGLAPVDKNPETYRIYVNFEPLPWVVEIDDYEQDYPLGCGNLLALLLGLTLSFIYCFNVILLVQERIQKSRLLQCMAGVSLMMLWFANFCYDLLKMCIIASIIVLNLYLQLTIQFPDKTKFLVWFFAILIIWSIPSILIKYIISILVDHKLTAYELITCFYAIGVFAFIMGVEMSFSSLNGPMLITDWLYYPYFHIIPMFSLCVAISKIYAIGELNILCSNPDISSISIYAEDCQAKPNCCLSHAIWNWGNGIKVEVYSMLAMALLYFFILCAIENKLLLKLFSQQSAKAYISLTPHRNNLPVRIAGSLSDNEDGADEDDVLNERRLVKNLKPRDRIHYPIVIDGAVKIFHNKSILGEIYLVVERATCVGILGANGAGKSLLAKLCVNEETIDNGRIFIESYNTRTEIKQACKHFSYNPAKYDPPIEFTGLQLLHFYCSLRGIPHHHTKRYCLNLAKVFGIFRQRHNRIATYSSGSRQRLCYAVAIIGNPSVVILDNIGAVLDPSGKQILFNVFYQLRKNGTTVLMFNVPPRDSERICDRIAILANGKFVTIGRPSDVSHKYLKGYILQIKVKCASWTFNSTPETYRKKNLNFMFQVINFVERTFENSLFKEELGNVLEFLVPEETTNMAGIYATMQQNATTYNIEGYIITRNLFTMVFADLTEAYTFTQNHEESMV